jgi:hypothetical protein
LLVIYFVVPKSRSLSLKHRLKIVRTAITFSQVMSPEP